MTDPPPNKIVTEGDAKVNVVNALGDLSRVASWLSSTISHLKVFVSEKVENAMQKKSI